jgi:hypothetical protein
MILEKVHTSSQRLPRVYRWRVNVKDLAESTRLGSEAVVGRMDADRESERLGAEEMPTN